MKKIYSLSTIFLLLFSCTTFIYTKYADPEFSIAACYLDPSKNSQISHQIFSTLNSGLSLHQDSYNLHQNYVREKLNSCWFLKCDQQYFIVQPEDAIVIEKICEDNQHISPDALRLLLARNPAINNIQNLHAHGKKSETSGFQSDIFIDKHHFDKVENSQQRIKSLEKAAVKSMDARHKSERINLENRHKNEKNAVKKESKSKHKEIESRHKQELLKLKTKHAQENKYPLGQQKKQVENSTAASQKNQIQLPAAISIDQQKTISSNQVSNINSQQLQILYDQTQPLTVHDQNQQSVSFNKVMQDRSQALQASISNPVATTQQIKINSQTMGFLQAQGIDATQFQQINGLPIQHQITHEIVDILDKLADAALHNSSNLFVQKGSLLCAQTASIAQQENHAHNLLEAMSGANCTHGLLHYVQGMAVQGFERCENMLEALAYFNIEVGKYALSAANGIAKGIVTTEIANTAIGAVGCAASACAPGLTATVSAGACAAMTPLAIAAGSICAMVVVGEVAQLGYFYATDQMVEFDRESDRITKIAQNFYDFDQSSYQHVENVAQGITTVGWSSCKETIMNTLQGLQNVHFEAYVEGKKIIQKSFTATKEAIARACEIIERPELSRFNGSYKKVFGQHFFEVTSQEQVALAGVAESINAQEISALIPITQNLLNEQSSSAGEKIVTTVVGHIAQQNIENQAQNTIAEVALIESKTLDVIAQNSHEIAAFQKALQDEIIQEMSVGFQPVVDLTIPISFQRAQELANLTPQLRQLQELAKKTNNFNNLDELIEFDIMHLNRVYSLQSYKKQLISFLAEHKPFFIYDGQQYFVEDFASYHIHAGDYFLKDNPDGAHSNYGGNKLDHFSPSLIKNGPIGSKDVLLSNPRNQNRTKRSCVYPETWSEYVCDLKAIEVITSKNVNISLGKNGKNFTIKGFTSDNLEIIIHYDIENKRIKTHYPDII